jgi:4-aminobutyrate aminotransferase-like enzyme
MCPGNKDPFLDVANNVAGVGHSHPLVVQASVTEMTNIQVSAGGTSKTCMS